MRAAPLAACITLLMLLLHAHSSAGTLGAGVLTAPHLDSENGIAPSTSPVTIGVHEAVIRLRGTSGEGTSIANVEVNIEGKGDAEAYVRPQQTVLLIDDSGSMDENDAGYLRVSAAREYISQMRMPDQGAVVRFGDYASLIHGLTMDYSSLKSSLDSAFHSSGATNMHDAFSVANSELISHQKDNNTWNYILLTDGCWNLGGDPQPEVDRASSAGIRVFTIGLGEDTGNCWTGLDSSDLRAWSSQTGGKYYHASAATDLYKIYKEIAKDIRDVAGYAPEGVPMVRIQMSQDIEVVPGSFNIAPDRPSSLKIGNRGLTLEWDRPAAMLRIGEVLTLRFSIQSYREGDRIPVNVVEHSVLQYVNVDGVAAFDGIDPLFVDVFRPKGPPGGGGGDGGGTPDGGGGGIIPPISKEDLEVASLGLFPFAVVLVLLFLLFVRRRRKRIQKELQKAREMERRKRATSSARAGKAVPEGDAGEDDAPRPIL